MCIFIKVYFKSFRFLFNEAVVNCGVTKPPTAVICPGRTEEDIDSYVKPPQIDEGTIPTWTPEQETQAKDTCKTELRKYPLMRDCETLNGEMFQKICTECAIDKLVSCESNYMCRTRILLNINIGSDAQDIGALHCS